MNAIYETRLQSVYFTKESYLKPMPHIHNEIEIVYVKNGYTTAHINKKQYQLNAGDLFIAFPNQIHFYDNNCEGTYYLLIISPNIVTDLNQLLTTTIPQENVIKNISDSVISELFMLSQKVKTVYKNTAIIGMSTLIVSLVLNELKLISINQSDNYILKSILDYCSCNYINTVTLDSLSKKLHVSKYYISHLLNQQLHISFNEYINNMRINKASRLLLETDKKIAEISEDVGFGTIRSFNTAFKYLIGCTPSKYRTMYSPKANLINDNI